MLEQVGESRVAGALVARSRRIPEVHGHDRRGVIDRVDDAQPVRQGERLVLDWARLAPEPGGQAGARRAEAGERGQEAAGGAARGQDEPHHSTGSTTAPQRTNSNENTPSRVSPFTTRRGARPVVSTRQPPPRTARTPNR